MVDFQLLGQAVAAMVLTTSIVQNLLYLALLILAFVSLTRRPFKAKARALWDDTVNQAPSLSIIVPAYNEAATITETIRSLMALEYPRFEVIIVNDGSTDDTLGSLREAFELQCEARPRNGELHQVQDHYLSARYENLLVIDKANGGKANALNTALSFAKGDLICAVDADSILESDSLLRAVQPFVDHPDRCVAVGGTVRVANGCKLRLGRVREVSLPKSWLALLQTIEYLRAFTMARLAWGQIGALTIVSGAFGLLRRDVMIASGGYDQDTVGEDLEIIVRMHRLMREKGEPYLIDFVPEPVCWTQVPEDISSLARQRTRWQRGALECFDRHKDMMGQQRYGAVGSLGLGSIFLLDIVTPIVELLGYFLLPIFWIKGIIGWEFFLAYLSMTFAFGVFISVGSLIIEELQLRRFPNARDIAKLTLVAILENFGYRQLNNFWRIQGMWAYWRGDKTWGDLKRRRFMEAT